VIYINSPEIERRDDNTRLASSIKVGEQTKILWYEVPSRFEQYLVVENLDAFLVGMLFYALKEGEDVQLNGTVSARLYYNINHYVIPALCLANHNLIPIKIHCRDLNEKDLNVGNTAGTGLSCGVDSFATYYDHFEEEGSYKIQYFAFFNVGSHGSGGDKTNLLFNKRFEKAKKFADHIGKEIIKINSNLSELLEMKFQSTNTLRNVSCVLVLQKLFKNYYIASKNRFDYFELHAYDTQDYDALILNLLSTESTMLHSAVAQLTRVDRTQLIAKYPETYNFLDVCTSSKKYRKGVNCSQCNKCLRTALTLDLLDRLDAYENVFHIEKYKKLKNSYIGHIIKTRKKDQINSHIYNLLIEKKAIDYWSIYTSRLKNRIGSFKK